MYSFLNTKEEKLILMNSFNQNPEKQEKESIEKVEKIESINNPVEMIINIPVIIKLVSGQNSPVKRQKVVTKRFT